MTTTRILESELAMWSIHALPPLIELLSPSVLVVCHLTGLLLVVVHLDVWLTSQQDVEDAADLDKKNSSTSFYILSIKSLMWY